MAQHHWTCVWTGRSTGRCKGRGRPERRTARTGRGCQVLTGDADRPSRLTGGLLLGESKRRPHLWDRGGFGDGEPAVGAALPGKLDGLEWSASTGLLGGKKRVLEPLPCLCFARKLASRRARCRCTAKSQSEWPASTVSFRLTALASSRGTSRHMAFLGPDSTPEREGSPTGGCRSCAARRAGHQ